MRTLQVLFALTAFSLMLAATARAVETAPQPLDDDLWDFKDKQLVFKSEAPPESAGTRCIEWKDYIWQISPDRIELRDTRKDGVTLKAKRLGRDETGAALSDKDWMKELAERAKDARKANEKARKAAEKAQEIAEKARKEATQRQANAQRLQELNEGRWDSPYYPPPWLMHRPLSQSDALGRGWDYYLRDPSVRDYRYYRPYQDLYLYGQRTREAEHAREAWEEARKKERAKVEGKKPDGTPPGRR